MSTFESLGSGVRSMVAAGVELGEGEGLGLGVAVEFVSMNELDFLARTSGARWNRPKQNKKNDASRINIFVSRERCIWLKVGRYQ